MAMQIDTQYDDEFLKEADFKQMLVSAKISFVQFQKIWNTIIIKIKSNLNLIMNTSIDKHFAKKYIELINKRLNHFEKIFNS